MKHPKSIGSRWIGQKYVHGPRITSPSRFSRLYTLSLAEAKKRLHRLPNAPAGVSKVIAGTLKKGGFKIQSYLVPVRRSKLVRSKRGSLFCRRKHLRKNYSSFKIPELDSEYLKERGYSGHIEMMSPETFLAKTQLQSETTMGKTPEEYEKMIKSSPAVARAAKGILSPTRQVPTPFLEYSDPEKWYKPTQHEGRHRMWAAKQLGIKEVPVKVYRKI